MISKRFTVFVVIRVLLLVLSLVILAYIFARTDLFFNQIILIGIIILQVIELIRFVTFSNREIAKLLMAIRYSDYSISFKNKSNQSFQEVQEALAEIIESFKKVSIEKEAQFRFLQIMIDNINVGVIAINEEEEIKLMNLEAEHLLSIEKPNYLKQLKQLRPDFISFVNEAHQTQSLLIELNQAEKQLPLSLKVDRIKILHTNYQLITFQNIKSEIETKEIEAWHKLIRILTHEIMNSITPIASMSETMLMMLSDQQEEADEKEIINQETLDDLRFSLKTIQKRSDGLLHFVEDYRKLTRIKNLDLQTIEVEDLIDSIIQLMIGDLDKQKVKLHLAIEKGLKIRADRILVEQVLINLITNARHALEKQEDPSLSITAYSKAQNKYVSITDNGVGIAKDKQDEIFIPFYSTKEKGSGIGLSLSKQIMKKHKGDLNVHSTLGVETTFTLEF